MEPHRTLWNVVESSGTFWREHYGKLWKVMEPYGTFRNMQEPGFVSKIEVDRRLWNVIEPYGRSQTLWKVPEHSQVQKYIINSRSFLRRVFTIPPFWHRYSLSCTELYHSPFPQEFTLSLSFLIHLHWLNSPFSVSFTLPTESVYSFPPFYFLFPPLLHPTHLPSHTPL